ncbi:MAG: DNA cytosine methyltransferase [Caulobacteraceae bacterium]|nr:DNA cytosine methyltransferase [Caulobacteraceae bacterium]
MGSGDATWRCGGRFSGVCDVTRAYYNEFDPKAAAWLRELIMRGLIADGDVDERSILDVRPDDLRGYTQCHFFAGIGGWSYALRLSGWPDDRPVWTGSPPCQPFSAAGRRLGRDDARHLSPHFLGLVGACRPAMLFGEQVASAAVFGPAASRAGRHAAGQPEWAWIDDLSDRLEAARYAVGASDIPAAGVGAPHIRQRTFFGAVRLADADRDGRYQAPLDRRDNTEHHSEPCGELGGLADANNTRLEGRAGVSERADQRTSGSNALVGGTNAPDGPWRDADWLFCRDGKWRPVEPGTFPLADRLPARVVRLRGYGNAINPWAAAEFIRAMMAVTA